MAIQRHKANIAGIKNLTDDVRIYTLKPEEKIDFEAGQFIICVLKDEEGKEVRRSYSIASSPREDGTFDLCLRILSDGAGSQIFDKFEGGEEIEFEGPVGKFVIEDLEKDHVFIAAGVGIAPVRGQIRYLFDNNFDKNITLFFGFRTENDYYFREEFEKLQKNNPNFKMMTSASKPNNWDGNKGRVNVIVAKHLENADNKIVYVCGPPLMIKEIVPILRDKGFERENIKLDIWEA